MNCFIPRRKSLKLGILALLVAILSTTAAFAQQEVTTHIVKKGETLYGIAATYGLTIEDIEQANPKLMGKKLKKGTKLHIPSLTAKREETEQARRDSLAAIEANGLTHLVQTGNTLESLAQQYGVGVDDIKRANPQLAPAFNLQAGTTIGIRPAKTPGLPQGYNHGVLSRTPACR